MAIVPPWRRFMFVPFWHLTNKGWLPEYLGRINLGGDETRGSRFVIVPFVGEFVWFDKHPCTDPMCEAHSGSGSQEVTDD